MLPNVDNICRSVRWSVGPSVGLSVGPSVGLNELQSSKFNAVGTIVQKHVMNTIPCDILVEDMDDMDNVYDVDDVDVVDNV